MCLNCENRSVLHGHELRRGLDSESSFRQFNAGGLNIMPLVNWKEGGPRGEIGQNYLLLSSR
jgi:hypothetical protein